MPDTGHGRASQRAGGSRVDVQDEGACKQAFRSTSDVTHLVSTVEIKHGFSDVMDTEESFRHWIGVLLPPRD
jgi:hypothetical protein